MKYIGPFFRMNTLSTKEIEGQLFFLSKEAIKTIVLNSKCGVTSSYRNSSKSSSKNDINILSNISPLVCVYKKASPILIHNKHSRSFDESSFKKDILPSSNAFMTLSLLEISNFYSFYRSENKNILSLKDSYKDLCKNQLDFYCDHLRNSEGFFVEKKNIADNSNKGFNLLDKGKKFSFSDQAFMMDAYYMYSTYYPEDEISSEYKEFALEILQMFIDFKEALYNLSFNESCKLLLSLNILFELSNNSDCKLLLIDLTDFLINKFDEKDYYNDNIDSCALFYIILTDTFKHTSIDTFNEKAEEILLKLKELYDDEKGIFLKLSSKKEIKYSSTEICFYFLAIILDNKLNEGDFQDRNMISNLYKNYFLNSGIIYSWPEAPTLDDSERYRGLSLKSKDMLDENFFKSSNTPSSISTGIAPLFSKSITYSYKKKLFESPKRSFDSSKNMLIFYMFIHYLKDDMFEVFINEFTQEEYINIDTTIQEDSINDISIDKNNSTE